MATAIIVKGGRLLPFVGGFLGGGVIAYQWGKRNALGDLEIRSSGTPHHSVHQKVEITQSPTHASVGMKEDGKTVSIKAGTGWFGSWKGGS
ncbi:MAG: hypothetical protein Edafosvirus2_20 [Edafosvirus sp.]|uniref:Uncharacterized protein n=1 Tax=Edafosvirus sp. TaxID=2487765 RepID=A0A3G4ZV20_9VIRU|nr:MAG: hypothetical protein Edafosvirus2_20 [Edafosvirus sp.]